MLVTVALLMPITRLLLMLLTHLLYLLIPSVQIKQIAQLHNMLLRRSWLCCSEQKTVHDDDN